MNVYPLKNSGEQEKPLKNFVVFLYTKKNGFEISSVSDDTFLVMPHPKSSAFNGPHVLKSAFEVLHVIPLSSMSSLIYMTFPHQTYKGFGNSNTTLYVTIGQNYHLYAALNIPANLENSAVATVLEKVSFHSKPKERQCQRIFKLLHTALILQVSKVLIKILQARPEQFMNCEISNITRVGETKVVLKILQARLQWYMNRETPDVQAGFRKGRGARDQIAKSFRSQKKLENSRKTSTYTSLTMLSPFTVQITTNCGKFLKRWEYQTT